MTDLFATYCDKFKPFGGKASSAIKNLKRVKHLVAQGFTGELHKGQEQDNHNDKVNSLVVIVQRINYLAQKKA